MTDGLVRASLKARIIEMRREIHELRQLPEELAGANEDLDHHDDDVLRRIIVRLALVKADLLERTKFH